MNNVITNLTASGLVKLAEVLAGNGRGKDELNAWASEVEQAAANRVAGESLSVELRGLRDAQGYTVFFDGEASDFDWAAIEE